MDKIYKYKVWCTTDSKWEYTYSENDNETSLPCPVNTAHTVDNSKLVITNNLLKDVIGTEILVGKTPDKMKLRGKVFTALKNSSTVVNYDVNEDFFIKDGALVTNNNVAGDTIDIALHQQDDTFIYQYVKDYPVSLLKDTGFEDQTLSETNFNGSRFKITYHSTGTTNDVTVGVQLNGQN